MSFEKIEIVRVVAEAIYISKFLSYTVLIDLSLDNFEHIWLKIKPPHQNAFLLCRPPSTNKAYFSPRLSPGMASHRSLLKLRLIRRC